MAIKFHGPLFGHRSFFLAAQILFFIALGDAAVDPWTGLFREFALSTKASIQNFMGQMGLSRANAASSLHQQQPLDPSNVATSFQQPPPCPLCRQFPGTNLSGRWRVSLMSRAFRLQTFTELDILIERTRAGQYFSQQRTFQELATDPPEPICPTFTVLLNPIDQLSGKWELAYGAGPDGRLKSIIGLWEQLPFDGATILWRIGSMEVAQCKSKIEGKWHKIIRKILGAVCIAMASTMPSMNSSESTGAAASFPSPPPLQFSSNNNSIGSNSTIPPGQFILLVQVDGWPNCGNFLVLTRGMDGEGVGRLRDLLEAKRIEGPMNRLERARCEPEQMDGGMAQK